MTNSELVERMYYSAMDRVHDFEILSELMSVRSDASAHLGILGFEILLKANLLLDGVQFGRSHNYSKLWNALPTASRDEIVRIGQSRYAGYFKIEQVPEALSAFGNVFTRARYDYEVHKDKSLDEIKRLGDEWLKRGAKDSEADFAYYPFIRKGLTLGMRRRIEQATSAEYDLPE